MSVQTVKRQMSGNVPWWRAVNKFWLTLTVFFSLCSAVTSSSVHPSLHLFLESWNPLVLQGKGDRLWWSSFCLLCVPLLRGRLVGTVEVSGRLLVRSSRVWTQCQEGKISALILDKELLLPIDLGRVIRSYPNHLESIVLQWKELFTRGKKKHSRQMTIFPGVEFQASSPKGQTVQCSKSTISDSTGLNYHVKCYSSWEDN